MGSPWRPLPHPDPLTLTPTPGGLSVAVFADWFEPDVMEALAYRDFGAKAMTQAVTGGSNDFKY